jgi:histidinol-phosphate/aromatic aminotransferase/cobyric acid decarboxylase-like protein
VIREPEALCSPKTRRFLPGAEILTGVANWVLCLLAREGPNAAQICERSRSRGVFLRDSGATSAVLGRHALRVAVKDETANRRIVETLAWAQGQTFRSA